jgi:hypothetical protein
MSERRFLLVWLLFAACLATAIGLLNAVIDPYRILNWIHIPGVNARKPEIYSHLRTAKAYAVRDVRPAAIILGNSRVEAGIDPAHAAWGVGPVYNLGLAGANIYEALRYLQHAHALAPVRRAAIGVDVGMFSRFHRPDFDEARLAVDAGGVRSPFPWPDLARNVFSVDASSSAVATILGQHRDDLRDYRRDGMREQAPEWIRLVRHGHRPAFIDTLRQPPEPISAVAYEHFAELLRFCRSKGIDLRLFMSPSHAWDMERIRAAGGWAELEDWKRRIVAALDAEAASAGREPFPIWDFSGYNEVTTETIPARGDKATRMVWYWEASHYTKATGDRVLSKILATPATDSARPGGFGHRLRGADLDAHLAEVRQAGARYRAAHAADVALIEASVAAVPRKPGRVAAR